MARRPSLYAPSGEGRHATWLELFFDLVFVLAIAELAHYLHDHLTVGGFFGFAFLFLPVWLVWSNYSYYADLFDVDGPFYRVAMLAAMLFSITLAVNVHSALDGGSAGFAAAYVSLRVLLIGLYAWAWRYVEETRALAAWHIAGFSAGLEQNPSLTGRPRPLDERLSQIDGRFDPNDFPPWEAVYQQAQ